MWGDCHFHPEAKRRSRGWLGKRQSGQVAAKLWYGDAPGYLHLMVPEREKWPWAGEVLGG